MRRSVTQFASINFPYCDYEERLHWISFIMTNTAHVKDWYDINAEGEHSRALHCRLEFAISLRIILQCLDQMLSDNSGPKHILDLGGATGRYGKF